MIVGSVSVNFHLFAMEDFFCFDFLFFRSFSPPYVAVMARGRGTLMVGFFEPILACARLVIASSNQRLLICV